MSQARFSQVSSSSLQEASFQCPRSLFYLLVDVDSWRRVQKVLFVRELGHDYQQVVTGSVH